jgi:hypothetical protein
VWSTPLSEYEELKKKLDASIYKDEARQRAIRKKREEKQAIKKAGGGHAIAKAIMPDDTDFNYGNNQVEDIDKHIEQEAASRCMGRSVCQTCGKFHGYCVEIDEEKEKLKMLPTGSESTSSSGGKKREGAMVWLKVEDLSTTPKEAKILMVRLNKNGRFGARVELKLAFEGKIVYWGVPPNKEQTNYSILINKFGADENDWVDQRILFFLEKDKFSEQYFIRVDIAKKK